jgi:translin
MINKKAFSDMRKELEKFDALREDLIKISRDILKISKASIYEIHRNSLSSAESKLKSAKKLIAKIEALIKKNPLLSSVGAYNEALEEYVEASCYFGFMKKKKLPTAKELGVRTNIYIPGVCDLVGELVRKAINSSIDGDFKTAKKIKDFVAAVYGELMMFNFRNIPARRKFDSIKYGLEKLENLILDLKLKKKLK